MNKKGASLSINIIVITIIVLVVLVIMILVFGRGVTTFTTGTRTCASLGGDCRARSTDINNPNAPCPEGMGYPIAGIDLCDSGEVCCSYN